jgi:transposase
VKNDERDASDLADLLRMNGLPEAWIAPPAVRELRELVRYRAKLVALRLGLKAQVHAVLAKEGVRVSMSDLFGRQGMALLAEVPLGRAYRLRVDSLVELIDASAEEAVTRLDRTSEIDNERRKQTQLQQQGASTRTSTPTTRLASCQMSPPLQEGAAFGS